MSEKGWKKAERAHAADLGSRRIPVTGERFGADFVDGLCAYQLKVRNSFPDWIFKWLGGICSRKDGKIGVLVLNKPHAPRSRALVILRWDDWVALHGDALKKGADLEDAQHDPTTAADGDPPNAGTDS